MSKFFHRGFLIAGLALATSGPLASQSSACGAYFGKRLPAEATVSSQLYNKSTKMVVARNGDTSTITMTADYRGDPQEFAVVIAVPTVLTREQIKVADRRLIEVLDQWSAPKLTESFDPDPCPKPTKAVPRSGPGSRPTISARYR